MHFKPCCDKCTKPERPIKDLCKRCSSAMANEIEHSWAIIGKILEVSYFYSHSCYFRNTLTQTEHKAQWLFSTPPVVILTKFSRWVFQLLLPKSKMVPQLNSPNQNKESMTQRMKMRKVMTTIMTRPKSTDSAFNSRLRPSMQILLRQHVISPAMVETISIPSLASPCWKSLTTA